jgi:hypothetical protein
MKKLLFVLASAYTAMCLGQTYPSPTYNTVSVVGGSLSVTGANPAISVSDTQTTNGSGQVLIKAGPTMWGLSNTQTTNRFAIDRYLNGTYQSSPLYIDGSSGLIHTPNGLTATGLTASSAAINGLSVTGTTTIGGPTTVSGLTTFSGSIIANSQVTMHAPPLVSFAGAVLGISDTSGTSNSSLILANSGTFVWGLNNYSGSNAFTLDRWVNGSNVDSPIRVDNGTGLVAMPDGLSTSALTATGDISTAHANAKVSINDTSGSGTASLLLQSAGVTGWNISENNASFNAFAINRYVAGVLTDSPLSINNSSGVVTLDNGFVGHKQASLQYAGPTLVFNDTSGTSQNTLAFQSASANEWQLLTDTSQFRVARYVSNAFVDNPLIIKNSSGSVAIKGTNTDDTAAVGYVGEFIKNHSVNTPVTSGEFANCSTLSLPPGDWDVWGNIEFTPSGTTTWNGMSSALSFVSQQDPGEEYQNKLNTTFSNSQPSNLPVVLQPLEISSTTTVYIVGMANFIGGSMTCDGYLEARRRR